MPLLITFIPMQAPIRTRVRGAGQVLSHACEDVSGARHRQKLPLGSVRGVTHLDALCAHCGAHFVWVEEVDDRPDAGDATETAAADG